MENGKIVIYRTADGETSIDVKLENDTVWLTQAQMAELFQKDQSVIARHIRNVFKEGELEEMSNMQILHNTFSKYKPTGDRKSTRLNSSHRSLSRMPSSA